MQFRLALGLVSALPLAAHVVSMSTGDLRIDGPRATYELRMPLYEISHVDNPSETLLRHIRFRSQDGEARLVRKSCRVGDQNYVCTGSYEFPGTVDRVEIECTYPSVTVPNHVHLLRAVKGDKSDQAVFDASFTTAEIRFRPPTPAEIVMRETGEGLWRAIAGAAPLLFLASLVLAGRSRKELALLAAMLLTGEIAACVIAPHISRPLPPRFVEAAAALTIAYLAVEILLLPQAGQRWLVVGVLGLFHGLYFAQFLSASGYRALPFLAGVGAAQVLVIAVLASVAWLVARKASFPWQRALASVLFVVGLAWFAVRLRS